MAKKSSKLAPVVSLRPSSRVRADGWVNIITQLGEGRDKRTGGRFQRIWVSELQAEEIWLASKLAAKIVEKPGKIMLRKGFTFEVTDLEPAGPTLDPMTVMDDAGPPPSMTKQKRGAPPMPPPPQKPNVRPGAPVPLKPVKPLAEIEAEDKENTEKRRIEADLTHKHEELGTVRAFLKAHAYSRAYGGGAVFIGVEDGEKDLTKPLNEKNLQSVDFLTHLRPRECWPRAWESNITSPRFGLPTRYMVRRDSIAGGSYGFEVHASRIIRFQGFEVSRRQLALNRGWGASIFGHLFDKLSDHESLWASSAALVQDFAQAVFSQEGLADLMASPEGEALIINRLRAMDLARSVGRVVPIDKNDTFERVATPMAGLPEVLDRHMHWFAANADMPASILFGEEPGGLNATGDLQLRSYYDDLEADRMLTIHPELRRLTRYILLAKEGPTKGVEPARWSCGFPPLYQETDGEAAKKRLDQANADKVYLDSQVLTPEEVAISRFGGGKWSGETTLDLASRHVAAEAMAEIDPAPTLPTEKPVPDNTGVSANAANTPST